MGRYTPRSRETRFRQDRAKLEDVSKRAINAEQAQALIDAALSPPSWSTLVGRQVVYNEHFRLDLNDFVIGAGTLSIIATGLPDGLTISDGIISGQPTEVGTHDIAVTATTAFGSADATFHIVVEGTTPVWSTISTQTFAYNGAVNLNLNDFVTGSPPLTITVSGLPRGLTATNGAITGQSPASGAHTIQATATNRTGTDTTSFSLVVEAAPVRFVMLDDSVNQLKWINIDGSEDETLRVSLGSSDWEGIIGGSRYVQLIDNTANDLRVFDLQTRSEVTSRKQDLPTAAWRGLVEADRKEYFLDNTRNQLRHFRNTINPVTTQLEFTEDVSERISLGTGQWQAVFNIDSTNRVAYLIDTTGNDRLREWDLRDGVEYTDFGPYALPSGVWRGGFYWNNRFYLIDLVSNTLRVFRFNAGNSIEEIPADSITLPSVSVWEAGFAYLG